MSDGVKSQSFTVTSSAGTYSCECCRLSWPAPGSSVYKKIQAPTGIAIKTAQPVDSINTWFST